jgi:hypothetical protein
MEQTHIQLWGIKCDKCNTMLTFGSSPNSIVCNFCGSRLNIEESKLPVNLTIGKNCFIISFKVSKEQFQNKILNWLVDGNYTPDDILYKANFQETLGIYLPFYHFSVNYRGYWNAEIKHYRDETYTDWEDYFDGKRTIKRPVTKTRQVGYWVPASGQFLVISWDWVLLPKICQKH